MTGLSWTKELRWLYVRKRAVLTVLVLSCAFGAFRHFHAPDEASAAAIALFVSLIVSAWMGVRVWSVLGGFLYNRLRALKDRLAPLECRLDRLIIASGQDPEQYEGEDKPSNPSSWSAKVDILLFSFAVRFSPGFLFTAVYDFLLAYIEWRTGILGMRVDLAGFYLLVGCLGTILFVWGMVYQWLTLHNAERKVKLYEEIVVLLENGQATQAIEIAKARDNGRTQQTYERKLRFYEQIERWIYRWVGVPTPA